MKTKIRNKDFYQIEMKSKDHKKIRHTIFVLGFLTCVVLGFQVGVNQIKKPLELIKMVIVKPDSIYKSDSAIIYSLTPILKKREGLVLKPYVLKGKSYIYYGHAILKGETFNNTESQADSVLIHDLRKSYFESERIKRLTLKKNVYSIFISGKP